MNDEFSEPFEGLRRMTEAASRAARDTKRLLDQLTSDVLRVAQLLPDLDELDDLEKRFMNLMIQSDWPPPLDVSLADVVELMKRYERDPDAVAATIDLWVMNLCSEEGLRSAVESWRACPLCRRRMPPLEAAVRAHLCGEYFCSIPVLLAQTEGLICDFLGSNTEHYLTPGMRKKVRKSLGHGVTGGIGVHIGRALREYYLKAVMASLAPSSASADSLRRNLILHGGDTTYGTLAMSWKALMLFDTVVETLKVAVVEGDESLYHLPTCERCQHAVAEAVKYVHIARPSELTGRAPCEVCGAPDLHVDEPLTDPTQ